MRRLLRWLTRGRPMRCVESCRFVDAVTGESVGVYTDDSGTEWLATSPWSLFRVRRPTWPRD